MRQILPVMSGLVAALVMYLLSRRVGHVPKQVGHQLAVEYGLGFKIMVAAFFPLSAFVTYAALQASAGQKTLAVFIALCFWLGTAYLAYEFFFVHLSYDDDLIYHQTPLRGQRQIPWAAITDVRYSDVTQAYTLKTDGYGDVSISPFSDGHQALLERAARQMNDFGSKD